MLEIQDRQIVDACEKLYFILSRQNLMIQELNSRLTRLEDRADIDDAEELKKWDKCKDGTLVKP